MKRKRIKIFRGGPQVTAAGQQIDFSESDLDGVVKSYDPATHEAPIVFGHPRDGAQAHGWVKSVSREGELLFADADFADEAVEAVQSGAFRKISASFYAPGDKRNPKPGSYHLRHVGLLGAQVPAVKGLGSVEFGEGGDGVTIELDFAEADPAPDAAPPPEPAPESSAPPAPTEPEPAKPEAPPDPMAALAAQMAELEAKAKALAEREKKIAAAEAEAKRTEVASFAESLVKQGRVLPRDRAGIVEFLLAMPEGEIAFSEGEKTRHIEPAAWLREFLGRLPKQIEFAEVSAPGGAEFSAHDHHSAEGIRAAALALCRAEAAAGREISYEAACLRVGQGAAK